MDTTTITVTTGVKKHLDHRKVHPRESYNDVISRILKALKHAREIDTESLAETAEILSDPETMRDIAKSVEELRAGRRLYSLDEV